MAEFPALAEAIVLTHFIVASDVDRTRRFYADVLGGEVLREGNRRSSRSRTAGLSSTSAGRPPMTSRRWRSSRRATPITSASDADAPTASAPGSGEGTRSSAADAFGISTLDDTPAVYPNAPVSDLLGLDGH
jgi:hypothetical protein